ncbi:MAG: sigma-70 family RNA polymerase sigma factor [Beijerinckiaceae bacterium]|nr:sigma-70 family RNA polymerase sigma factor [Beijerinckiaceae bacterium]
MTKTREKTLEHTRIEVREEDQLGDMMRLALAGNSAVYADLLKEVAKLARGSARSMLRRRGQSDADLEDIVQEVLLAVHLKRGAWDKVRPFRPWLGAIVRHKLIDAMRRRRLGDVSVDEIADILPAETTAPSDAHDVERTLACLPERPRAIVRAIAIEGRSAAQVGADFGMNEGAVRVALHRALKDLAARFRGRTE